MSGVIGWIKSHFLIVVFVLIMIAAPVAMLVLSGRMASAVRDKVDERAGLKTKLDQLSRTQVTLTGPNGEPESHQVLVNEQLLKAYETRVQAERSDADEVVALALRHNRGEHDVLMSELLPDAPRESLPVLRIDFHQALQQAYDELYADLGGGTPPDTESLGEDLTRVRAQFLDSILKNEESDLTEEEQSKLTERLSSQRLRRYEEAASAIKVYAPIDVLDRPVWDQSNLPEPLELFDWQWRYWIQRDVLGAIAAANGESAAVLQAPVKRILWMTIGEQEAVASSGGGGMSFGGAGAGIGSAGAGGGTMGRRDPGGAGGGAGDGGPAPIPIDFAQEAPRDFGYSFTGRHTNPLYDVRIVDLGLIVDSARLPEVLEALARQNFMTVLSLEILGVDQFEHVGEGYLYGSGAMSEVRLEIETIWLREWTKDFMPRDLKIALGIPIPQETPAAPAG